MDDEQRILEIMVDIYSDLPKQAPGSPASTLKALRFCTDLVANPQVLDIGVGTGAQTITLGNALDGKIIAIELIEAFVNKLTEQVADLGLSDKIQAQVGDMSQLDFPPQSIDLIWSEGSAYSIGFANAVNYWQQFLKPQGYLVVSELVWLKTDSPPELADFWSEEYPDMQQVDVLPTIFTENGYELIEQFTLPDADWWFYYDPLLAKLPQLREQYSKDELALSILVGIEIEITTRRRFADWYGYQFFIARNK